jgi:two-component system LytT family sensor kinase
MVNYKLQNYKQIIWHAIAIGLFIAYEILIYFSIQAMPSIQSVTIMYSRDVLFFVLMGYYFLPTVWQKIPNPLYRFFILTLIIIVYTLCICISGLLNQSLKERSIVLDLSLANIIASSFRAIYITIIATAYSFARYSIAKAKEAYEQKMLKIVAETKMENNFIRSQVSPHLFFNSLSFLYTKTLKETPEVARTVYLLVGMSEYALANEKEDDQVLLEEDIVQMQRYVELQQTLHNYRLHVTFNINLPGYDLDIFLPPLLFINFIENVFKYGDLNDKQNPALIELYANDRTLKFMSRNKVQNFQPNVSKGIGSVNAQARIKKHFGDKSEIIIFQADNIYTVEITITL